MTSAGLLFGFGAPSLAANRDGEAISGDATTTSAHSLASQADAVTQAPAPLRSEAIPANASNLAALIAQQSAPAGSHRTGVAASKLAATPPDRFAVGTAMATTPVLSAGRANAPDVFGSVAMPVLHTPLDAKWRVIDQEALGEGPWSPLIRQLSSTSPILQVGEVNRWVNARISFASDESTQGKGDDWAGASRSLLAHRGDCEDYAIAKLQILRAMGFSEDDLYLVIAHDLVRRADHAILAVRVRGELKILDNQTDDLLDGQAAQDYRPIVSYSGHHAWVHGFQVTHASTAMTSGPVQVASR